MALEEKTKIWMAIKAALPIINKSGLNSVEILLWSQDKDLGQVMKRLEEIKDEVEENIKLGEGYTNEDKEEVHEDILLDYSPDNVHTDTTRENIHIWFNLIISLKE